MVLASHTRSNGGLHQTRQRGEHVDRGEDLLVVQLSVQVDLALSDISGKIRDRVGDVVVRHGKDGELGDGSGGASDTSGTLVDGGQICFSCQRYDEMGGGG